MTDDNKMVSLRMGEDEIQRLDEFLEGHPELGGRSLFIRTAIRQYIERDAGVQRTSNKNEITIRFAAAELETIDSMIDDGTFIDRADAVRNLVRGIIVENADVSAVAHGKYRSAINPIR